VITTGVPISVRTVAPRNNDGQSGFTATRPSPTGVFERFLVRATHVENAMAIGVDHVVLTSAATMTASSVPIRCEPASEHDVPLVLQFVKELAEYERLADSVVATEDDLRIWLFGPHRVAYAVLAYAGDEPAGFAVYFFSFSTFLAKPGLYLEDLYVRPEWRGRGIGRGLLAHLARIAIGRDCGRMEWAVLNWNELALGVYRAIGARPMDEWTVQRLTGPSLVALAATAPAVPPPSAT
jgi:GNAT superfamily N-acetyltransferase